MYNKNEQAQLEAIARQQRANAMAKADAKSREYFANIRKIYERDLINNIAMKKGDSSYRGVMQTASFMNNYKEVGYTDSQVKNMTETQLLANAIMYNIATSVAGDQISVPKKEAKQAAVNAIYALDILSGREDSIDSDYEAVLMNLAGVSKHGKYYVRSMIGEEKDVVKQFSPIAYDSFGSADDTRVAGKGVLRVNMFTDSFLLKYASTIFESSRTIEGSIEEERMARATGNPMSQRFGDTSHTLMNFTAPALSLVEMILIGKLTGGAGSAMGLAARGSTLLSRTAIIANSVAKTQYAGRRAEYGLGEEYTTKMKIDDLVFDVVSMWAGMAVTDAVTDMMWSGMFKNAHISSFGKTFSGNMTNKALLRNTAVNVLYGLSNTTLDTAIDYGIYHSFVSLGGEMSVSNRQMFDFREGEN
ncbi:MAG: hypothetical protein GX025_10300, partial [Clostridiales bacterium]|nr:hypothetical protein [Clostridiales bacterium]